MVSRIFTFIGLFVSVAGIILLLAGSRALAAPRTMSYKAWKADKIHVCNSRLKNLRIKYAEARHGRDNNWAHQIEQDITTEKWRLEVAKELSVKDYLSLYVVPQLPDRNPNRRLKEIAATFSREEVAQVLETYVQMVARPQVANTQVRVQALSNDR